MRLESSGLKRWEGWEDVCSLDLARVAIVIFPFGISRVPGRSLRGLKAGFSNVALDGEGNMAGEVLERAN